MEEPRTADARNASKVVEKRWTRDHRLLTISLAGRACVRMLSLFLAGSFLATKELKIDACLQSAVPGFTPSYHRPRPVRRRFPFCLLSITSASLGAIMPLSGGWSKWFGVKSSQAALPSQSFSSLDLPLRDAFHAPRAADPPRGFASAIARII